MSSRPRPNPFYVVLLLVSTLFVVTALGYTVSPSVTIKAEREGTSPGAGSEAMAGWLDRYGPTALGVEFVVMLAAGVLAMATDRLFSGPGQPGRS